MTGPVRPRVLLVDDDPEICDFLATLLDLEGLEPLVASGAPEALGQASRASAALIDVAMPEVDGFTLCRRLRQGGFTAPILLASARPGPELARQAALAGADEFVRKPFDNVDLVARLKALIAGSVAR
jgi:two-component system response regulator MprA